VLDRLLLLCHCSSLTSRDGGGEPRSPKGRISLRVWHVFESIFQVTVFTTSSGIKFHCPGEVFLVLFTVILPQKINSSLISSLWSNAGVLRLATVSKRRLFINC
jgi:hypothetical protein